jgi:hypothetical protein
MKNLQGIEEWLSYDKDTGIVSWAKRPNRRIRIGDPAGTVTPGGYLRVKVLGELHYAHRIAWHMTFGYQPTEEIDHIDGDKLNNQLANLRVVDRATNCQNKRRPMSRNALGVLGVYEAYGRFRADIGINKKTVHLGAFDTAEQAHAAYLEAKRLHHKGCTI